MTTHRWSAAVASGRPASGRHEAYRGGMDQLASRGQGARLLAVLAVLLGLLAMHAVASGHHAAASPPAPGAVPVTASLPTQIDHPGHAGTHDQVMSAAQPAAQPAAAAPAGPSCHDDCWSVTALCVAVLVGVALMLLLRARGRASRLLRIPARPRAPAPAPAPKVRHARGLDPVRELCVSRT